MALKSCYEHVKTKACHRLEKTCWHDVVLVELHPLLSTLTENDDDLRKGNLSTLINYAIREYMRMRVLT